MHFNRSRRTWCAAASGVLAASTAFTAVPSASAAAATEAPAATASTYITLTGTASDGPLAYDAGCAEGKKGRSGLRILFLGTVESGNTLRQPGTSAGSSTPRAPLSRTTMVAEEWAEGFAECRTNDAEAIVALGVNNKSDGGVSGTPAGRTWAQAVDKAAAAVNAKGVTVAAAFDGETGWSSPAWARAWVDAFAAHSDRMLYAANSAGGCPTYGSSSTGCNNGWTLADVHYIASGADKRIQAVPQIYRTDGIQARQWAKVSSWGAESGNGPVRFAGALSQHGACKQRGGCERTKNSPADAWNQLWEELNAHPETSIDELPYSTDMRWP